MRRPAFHRLADRELNEAAQYYELESEGLGSAFLKEVDAILRGSVRRRLLRQFPYALVYKIKPDSIRILAVMNNRRRPTYWVGRE